jgi:hypothetical protein
VIRIGQVFHNRDVERGEVSRVNRVLGEICDNGSDIKSHNLVGVCVRGIGLSNQVVLHIDRLPSEWSEVDNDLPSLGNSGPKVSGDYWSGGPAK